MSKMLMPHGTQFSPLLGVFLGALGVSALAFIPIVNNLGFRR